MEERLVVHGHYEIKDRKNDLIGEGGMGTVYKGVDLRTGLPVAVKHLKPELVASDPQQVERFAREGEALRQLNHPNIVKVLATAEEKDQHYIVMEYVEGGSLRELMNRQRQLPLEQVINIGLELADALTRAHHLHIPPADRFRHRPHRRPESNYPGRNADGNLCLSQPGSLQRPGARRPN
jgi:serine/threonine-protein kinase